MENTSQWYYGANASGCRGVDGVIASHILLARYDAINVLECSAAEIVIDTPLTAPVRKSSLHESCLVIKINRGDSTR